MTASNSAGNNQATSAATAVVPQAPQPPANTQPPQITGTSTVGQQLQANPGTWTGSPAPTFTYQWQRCDSSGNNCNPIQSATNATYTINNTDAGSTLEVTVTASNSAGNNQATSAATAVVPQAPANTQLPQISGTVAVGQQLQANAGTWTGSPAPTFTYQWQRCDSSGNNCNPIQSATNATYTINNTDAGSTLDVTVTATNSAGNNQATSGTTAVVAQAPANTQPPQITGTATVGQQLQASPGTWTGSPTPTYTYQWQRCDSSGNNCNPIQSATNATYTITKVDIGLTLAVVVTGTNSAGNARAASAATGIVPYAPTTPVLDNFNRANGSVGSNWTVMHAGSFSTMNIANNVAVNPGSASQYAWNYWNPATFGPDVEAYATVATYSGNDTLRIGARVSVNSSTYNGYFVSIAANGLWSILRITAGTPTTLVSGVTDPISSGDQIGIRIVGSVITALHGTPAGWRPVLSYNTGNDATRYTAAGLLSFEFRTSTIDDFGGGGI